MEERIIKEMEKLADKMGVKKIIISHFNNDKYKDFITIVINEDLVLNLIGKTIYYIPLTEKGINKKIQHANNVIASVENVLKAMNISV